VCAYHILGVPYKVTKNGLCGDPINLSMT